MAGKQLSSTVDNHEQIWPKRRHTSSVPSSPANDCGCACGKPGSCSSACSRHALPYDRHNLHGRAGHPCLACQVGCVLIKWPAENKLVYL